MNAKNFLLLLLCVGFITTQAAIELSEMTVNPAIEEAKKYSCKCYCSYQCGPRFPDNPDDAPFIDPATGICFCQERDRATYFLHGCYKKNNAKIFNSCCDQQSNEAALPIEDVKTNLEEDVKEMPAQDVKTK